MYDSKINSIIIVCIKTNDAPLSSVDRNKLSQQLGISRNSSYVLQRERKLPPPISPPLGPKFWHRYEVDAILLSMSDASITPESMASSLVESRSKLPELILQAHSTKSKGSSA